MKKENNHSLACYVHLYLRLQGAAVSTKDDLVEENYRLSEENRELKRQLDDMKERYIKLHEEMYDLQKEKIKELSGKLK